MVSNSKSTAPTDAPGPQAGPDAATGEPAGAGAHPISYLWPVIMAASASEASASFFKQIAQTWVGHSRRPQQPCEPDWTTENEIARELPSMRLRDFSRGEGGQGTLICAPFALHGATIADLAPGHSVVEALRRSGIARVFVTDWRSADSAMQYFSIDSYLADLNVAIDDIGPPVDLIGLCQGGWMALVYAARFPQKIRRLVLVGAPVDVRAGQSQLSRTAIETPLSVFEALVRLGEGRVRGQHVLELWAPALIAKEAGRVLQVPLTDGSAQMDALKRQFEVWYAWTVDLPGVYYLEVVQRLFKENQIAEGRFVALGRTIDLATVRAPIYLLAGRDDELIHPEQLFAAARLVATPKDCIETAVEPCTHLSLFLGARTLDLAWRRVAQWLARDLPPLS